MTATPAVAVTASLLGKRIYLAHLGCRKLGSLLDDFRKAKRQFPERLAEMWDERFPRKWRNKTEVKDNLAAALAQVLDHFDGNPRGFVMYDTMRKGSDYWRPGALLTDVADILREKCPFAEVMYAREDMFCPSRPLLDSARDSMPFGEFAMQYARELDGSNAVPAAAMATVVAQSQEKIATFCCTDPYIPDFGDWQQMLGHVPYDKRKWIEELCEYGCHRVVLAEEIIRYFVNRGLSVTLFEIDSTFYVHVREFAGKEICPH